MNTTTTRHVAEITGPVTGETTRLTAGTESALEQLLEQHLAETYPDPAPPAGDPSAAATTHTGWTSRRRGDTLDTPTAAGPDQPENPGARP